MCRIFGFRSVMQSGVHRSLVSADNALVLQSERHPDGWGVAYYVAGAPHVVKSAAAAVSDHLFRHVSGVVTSETVLAHIRKATQGGIALENTHPFQRELWGRTWVFAHNGDLKQYAPRLHAGFRPVGDTDSERAFCWLMQELAKAHASVPSVAELSVTLRELVPGIAAHGSFNFMLSNGQALWAHCSTKLHWLVREHPFRSARLADEDLSVDFSALTTPSDRVAVVVTEPLTADEQWNPLAPGELAVFRDGARMI